MNPSRLYPLKFRPIFKERVWGGSMLRQLFGKELPDQTPIGESWEMSDRAGDVSVIANGVYAGKALRWVMEQHGAELLGKPVAPEERFPLLIKLLDAREKLSLQVHPPASMAARLGGESKTEMWYIAHAEPGAELYVGLRRGVTRLDFERKLDDGSVADCFHRVPVRRGDVMFLPSGRVHAIGAGLVIFEIQENSDTTYRVFDWNRLGLDGKPRALHVAESLACIDFNDFEPALVPSRFSGGPELQRRALVLDPLFEAEEIRLADQARCVVPGGRAQILGVVSGAVQVEHPALTVRAGPGEFCLIPAALQEVSVVAENGGVFLRVQLPGNAPR